MRGRLARTNLLRHKYSEMGELQAVAEQPGAARTMKRRDERWVLGPVMTLQPAISSRGHDCDSWVTCLTMTVPKLLPSEPGLPKALAKRGFQGSRTIDYGGRGPRLRYLRQTTLCCWTAHSNVKEKENRNSRMLVI